MSVKDYFSVAATLSQLRYLVFHGMKGDTGQSAYDLAVENGFVGTVVQWLASLKGEPGANGRDGQDGAPGAPGTPGRDGVSPTVQTSTITGGHRVTITDAEHPAGQSFDVMDGEGGGGAVDSVNGKTGTVVLTASDVGALPAGTPIPSAVTEQTVAGWGFTKNTGTYSKPSSGIPDSDIASAAVWNAKADASDIPTRTSELENDSGYQTAAQVQAAAAGKADKEPRVAMTAQDTTAALEPNRLYVFPDMSALTITLAAPADSTVVNEYHFIFGSGAAAATLTIPATINQPDGFTVEANHVYEVSILEGCMTAQGWAVSA